MAVIGRLAGALLVESGTEYWLVGDLKEPCDFAAHGFEPPGPTSAKAQVCTRLRPVRAITLGPPLLRADTTLEGAQLADLVARRFVIERNRSVSERLWRLVSDSAGDARWLLEVPDVVWQIVRDGVLKCS